MTVLENGSPFVKALAAAGVVALALTGCAAAEETPAETESAAEETPTTTPGGCELGPEQDGDLVLKLGTALPLTGNLAFLGPPEEAGVYLAVDETQVLRRLLVPHPPEHRCSSLTV